MTAKLAKEMTVRELATARGKSVRTIQRWLRRLDRTAGGGVVYRDGNRMCTTMRALHEADPKLVELRELDREQLDALSKKRLEDARRIASLENQVKNLIDTVSLLLDSPA